MVAAAPVSKSPTMPRQIEIHHRIPRDDVEQHTLTARALSRCVDVVSIQHAFGIWGGEDGAYVLDFARALDVPSIVTLHTVHPDPTPSRRAIIEELVGRADATVVMSHASAARLASVYGA
ncbi:MAG: hypothetical protein MUE82_09755, partial [Chloroflexi bacterium]|nr:hypothetical protein [Chloroflexota bacterium]